MSACNPLRRLAACVLAAVLAAGSSPAVAHTRSETHSAWQINGTTVHLQFTVPDLEAQRITSDGAMPSVDQLGRYIAEHVGASSGDQSLQDDRRSAADRVGAGTAATSSPSNARTPTTSR